MLTNTQLVDYTIGRQTNESNFSRSDLIGNNRLQLYPTVCDEHFTCGEERNLSEKCKIQMNQLTTQISDSSCNTSYVWLGGEGGKNNSEEGFNPNNNVITIK